MAEVNNGNEKIMGAVTYLLGPVTGILFLITEKKNSYIRYHAMQSTVVFGAIVLLYLVLGIIPILGWLLALILSPIITLVSFILWLMLMWKAYSGEKYKLPYFGELAEKQLAKLK
ncbi:DUF4870 domain-containing protein [Candidatus Gottesmanbacteria bacterium]|nr:DUF4870 domain-containing protein [Candidatus Gottesmanbacteria bacterium]